MAQNIRTHLKRLEKLSLVTCSSEVLPLLERALENVKPILSIDTKDIEPLLWQKELTPDRLNEDTPRTRLTTEDIKKNASGFYEDYVAVGVIPGTGLKPKSE